MTFGSADVAVSAREITCSGQRGGRTALRSTTALSGSLQRIFGLLAPAIAASILTISADALAQTANVAPNTLPTGGTVVAGSSTITQPSANKLQVTQTTDKSIIDWRTYSIGSNAWVNYTQPGAGSVSLNRVTGGDASYIFGKLTANGIVMLINPNGVVFGRGSVVDVAGLVATTANIRNDDFMAGRMNFTIPGKPNSTIINEGNITIKDAGIGAFVAPGVENRGVIEARLGTVSLASGNTFTLDLYGDGLVKLAVTDPVTVAALGEGRPLVSNSGTIKADGGKVLITAAAAKGVVDTVINMDGVVQARRVSQTADGAIILDGGENGTVNVAGTVDVSARTPGNAGKVKITGEKVRLTATARIDATAINGTGGEVKIGGDFQGKGTTRQAKIVTIDAGALINASATETGNGGTVIVWSTDTTTFNGIIMARGGDQAGNGGFIETSGHNLAIGNTAVVDLSAPAGIGGSWLLDPDSITIQATAGTCATVPTCNAGADAQTVDDAVIEAALTGAAIVTLSATNFIQVDASITWSGSSNTADLVLSAPHIIVNATINSQGSGTGRDLSFANVATQLTLNAVLDIDGSILGRDNLTTVNIVSNSARIQQGIDLVQAGGIVNIAAGDYFQNFTINKSLTLSGAMSAVPGQDPSRGTGETVLHPKDPAFIVNETIITIAGGVNDVTIKGFTIDGFDGVNSGFLQNTNPADTSNRAFIGITNTGALGNNITISNNIFKNIEFRAIDLSGPNTAALASTGLVISGNVVKTMGTGILGFEFSIGDAIRLNRNIFGAVSDNTIDGTSLNGIVVENVNYTGEPLSLTFTNNELTAGLTTLASFKFKNIDTLSTYAINGGTIKGGLISTGVQVTGSNHIDLTLTGVTIKGGLYGVTTKDSHGNLTIIGGSMASAIDLATLLSLTGSPDLEDIGEIVSLAALENLSVMINGVLVEPGMNTVVIDGTSFSTILGDAVKVSGLAASSFTAINGSYVLIGGNAINFDNQAVASTVDIHDNFFAVVLQNAIRIADISAPSDVSITGNTILGVGQHGILLENFSNGGHVVNVSKNDIGIVVAGNAITLTGFSGYSSNTVTVNENLIGVVLAGHGILLQDFSASTNYFNVNENKVLGVVVGDGIRLENFSTYAQGTVYKNFVTLTAGSGIVLDTFTGGSWIEANRNKIVGVGGDGIRFSNFAADCHAWNEVWANKNIVIGAANTGSGIVFQYFSGTSYATASHNLISLVSGDGIRFDGFEGRNHATATWNVILGVHGDGIRFNDFDGRNYATAKLNFIGGASENGIAFNHFKGKNYASASLNIILGVGEDGIRFNHFKGYNHASATLNLINGAGDDGIQFKDFGGYWVYVGGYEGSEGQERIASSEGGYWKYVGGINYASATLNIISHVKDDGISFDKFNGKNLATAKLNLIHDAGGDGIEFSHFKGLNITTAAFNAIFDVGDDGIKFGHFKGVNIATAAFNLVKHAGGDGIQFSHFKGINVANAWFNSVKGVHEDGIAFDGFFGASFANASHNTVKGAGEDGIAFRNFLGVQLVRAHDNEISWVRGDGIEAKYMFGLTAIKITDNDIYRAKGDGIDVGHLFGLNLVKIDDNWIKKVGDDGVSLSYIDGKSLILVTDNYIKHAKTGVSYSHIDDAIAFIAYNHIGHVKTGLEFTHLGDNAIRIDSNYIQAKHYGIYFGLIRPGNDTLVTLRSNRVWMSPWGTGLYVDNFKWNHPGDPAYVGTYTFDFDSDHYSRNIFKGGNEGIRMKGEGLFLVNDTFGYTEFKYTINNYITLTKGALFRPDEPTLISIANVSFDGFVLGPNPTNAQKAFIEARVTHFLDHPPFEAGLFFPLVPVPESATGLPEIPNFELPQWDPDRIFEIKWFTPFLTSFGWNSGGPYNFATFVLNFPIANLQPGAGTPLGELAPESGPEAKKVDDCTQSFMTNFWAWYGQCQQTGIQ